MKTDTLFYELFKLDPQSLIQLVDLDVKGEYIFESITVKTTEKRFLQRVQLSGCRVQVYSSGDMESFGCINAN